MKTISMEYVEYKDELNKSRIRGYQQGIEIVRRMVIEMSNGASEETILSNIVEDNEDLFKLYNGLKSRLEFKKNTNSRKATT